jgi:transcriptional regulator with XRE-family HTH domain
MSIVAEYRDAVPAALRGDPRSAKLLARDVGVTPRAVENWRDGGHTPSVPSFFALAREIPTLKRLALKWLDEAQSEGGDDRCAAALLRRALAAVEARQIAVRTKTDGDR